MRKLLFAILCLALPAAAAAAGNSQGAVGAAATTQRVGAQLVTTKAITFTNPHEIKLYHVTCAKGKWLKAQIADCCIPGDKWELKVDVKDALPNEGVTMAPGGAGVWSFPARVLTYGKPVDALVRVSYPHGGVAQWPAGATLKFTTASNCTPVVTLLGTEYH